LGIISKIWCKKIKILQQVEEEEEEEEGGVEGGDLYFLNQVLPALHPHS
jgi:hypothetical protein